MTFDDSFKELDGNHRYKLHTIKVLPKVWFIHLVGLIYRFYSSFVSEKTLFHIKPRWSRFYKPITYHDITDSYVWQK